MSSNISNQVELSGFYLERTAKRMKQILQGRLKEMNAGITVDQWLVLNLVETSADVSQQAICEELSKDAPTITRIIDLLEKKKFIKRMLNPNDRRKYSIALTKRGHAILSKVTPAVHQFRQLAYAGLGNNDLKKMKNLLHQINDNLNNI